MRKQNRNGGVGAESVEQLEPRCLLSSGAGLEVFSASAPAVFVENRGQWSDPLVRYGYQSDGAAVAFTDTGVQFQLSEGGAGQDTSSLQSVKFSASFVGASPRRPVGAEQAAGLFNYYMGDVSLHRSDVPGFEQVRYSELYAGVDLYTYGKQGQLKYEFHVDPGADYRQVQIRYSGIEGLSIAADGSLHIQTALGEMVDSAPVIHQEIAGQRQEVAGRFVLLDGNTYGFEVTGQWDHRYELVLDPELEWSTYAERSASVDRGAGGNALATDGWGNVVVAGIFVNNGQCMYATKLSATGEHLWSTYFGGGREYLWASQGDLLAIDSTGNVLVAGWTEAPGWVSGGYDTGFSGYDDVFVVKLASTGEQLWSTYVGGANSEEYGDLAVDNAGNVLVTGETTSGGWVSGGYDTSYNGGGEYWDWDGFVVKISPTGEHLWSTYLGDGSSGVTDGRSIVADASGNVLVAGRTYSGGWVSGGYDTSYNGRNDGFVVKLSPTGEHLWSTYVGGADNDWVADVTVDGGGNVLVAGTTGPGDWVSGGYDTSYNGGEDGFVVKLSATGEHLWSTYLGGAGWEYCHQIAADGEGNVLVTGGTSSSGWVSGGYDTSFGGNWGDAVVKWDDYVVKLSPTGEHLWSTYLGGSEQEWPARMHDTGGIWGGSMAVDRWGNVVVAGTTASAGWVSGGFDTSYGGGDLDLEGGDGFVVMLSPAGDHLWSSYFGGSGNDFCRGVALDDQENVLVMGNGGIDDASGTGSGEWGILVAKIRPGIGLAPSRVVEDQPAGTLVGTLRALGSDSQDSFSYSLVEGDGAGDNASFYLVGAELHAAVVFDYEAQNSYSIRIRATGESGAILEQVYTIRILDVNEAPTALQLSNSSLGEIRPVGTVVGSLSTEDQDANERFTYTLVEGVGAEDNAKFAIMGDQLQVASSLDRIGSGSCTVRVRSTDSGGLWIEQVFVIHMPVLPPEAALVGTPQIIWTSLGRRSAELTLHLVAHAAPLDLASIDGDELVVSGPAGAVSLSLLSVTAAADGYSAEVTYRLAAPGGRWDQADNGPYALAVPAGSFSDTQGHQNRARDLGGMGATLPGPLDVLVPGTPNADLLSVTLTNSEYVVQINGIGFAYDASLVRSIRIYGYGGNDRITINGESYICEVSAGAGNDTISGGSGDDLIRGDEDNDVITGNGGDDTLYGNFGNDSITGGEGADAIMAGLGYDFLAGGAGNDSLYGGDQMDTVYGDAGDDYIEGRGKADTIYGGAGNDTILGGAGSDSILGDDGDDRIWVGLHILFADSVNGGAGNDVSDGDANDVLSEVESVLA